MLPHTLALTLQLSLCFLSVAVCMKQCTNYCSKGDHAFGTTVLASVKESVSYCVLMCWNMGLCEGFNYDSATATCHLINSADNLTPTGGLTAWSMNLCNGVYKFLIFSFQYLNQN